jgi:UDP-glucose 4-epimerase
MLRRFNGTIICGWNGEGIEMNGRMMLITGGAGFIGSHLTERLLNEGNRVIVLDNFSSGKIENIQHLLDNPSITLVKEDMKKPKQLGKIVSSSEIIFHLAANPEVRLDEIDPKTHFEENILATFNLLEAIRKDGKAKTLVFASSSTVYGEARLVPTQEDYGPLMPISTYGASKLACEALIASYAYTFNLQALILRPANIVGSRSTHGVILDFIRKINANPKRLEILGDGHQEKSYLHVSDCVEAIMHVVEASARGTQKVDVYNVGSNDKITVAQIAKIVSEAMGKPDIDYEFTGGVEGGGGWKGDVRIMQLSTDKLQRTGWKPRYSSEQAVRLAARALMRENTRG